MMIIQQKQKKTQFIRQNKDKRHRKAHRLSSQIQKSTGERNSSAESRFGRGPTPVNKTNQISNIETANPNLKHGAKEKKSNTLEKRRRSGKKEAAAEEHAASMQGEGFVKTKFRIISNKNPNSAALFFVVLRSFGVRLPERETRESMKQEKYKQN